MGTGKVACPLFSPKEQTKRFIKDPKLENLPILGDVGKNLGQSTAEFVENPNVETGAKAFGALSGAFLTTVGGASIPKGVNSLRGAGASETAVVAESQEAAQIGRGSRTVEARTGEGITATAPMDGTPSLVQRGLDKLRDLYRNSPLDNEVGAIGEDIPSLIERAENATSPKLVYRGGSRTPTNLTPRITDTEGLSTFDALERAVEPGGKAQVIDTTRLNKLCPVCDAPPEGHVSIRPGQEVDPIRIQEWSATRGSDKIHPLTQELMDAIVDEVRRPK